MTKFTCAWCSFHCYTAHHLCILHQSVVVCTNNWVQNKQRSDEYRVWVFLYVLKYPSQMAYKYFSEHILYKYGIQ